MSMDHLCFREFRQPASDPQDPVAMRVAWTLLAAHGDPAGNELVETPTTLIARRSAGSTAVHLVPVAVLGIAMVGGGLYALVNGEWLASAIALGLAGVLARGVSRFLARDIGLTLDLAAGVYHRGPAWRPQALPAGEQGALSSIHAVQVLAAEVTTVDQETRSSTPSTQFEVNLVLEDGTRLGVLDHGRGDRVMQAARRLSERLDVPLWAATC